MPSIVVSAGNKPRVLFGGGAAPSALESSLVADPVALDADGVAESDVTYTALTATAQPLPGVTGTQAAVVAWVDVAESTLTCAETEVPDDGTTPANFEAVLYDTDGIPVTGLSAAYVVLSSSRGATDTITAVDTVTNRNGRFQWTVVSSTAGTPVFTVTVNGVAVTETATVEFTGTPALPTLDWFGDWSYDTGTGADAVGDGPSGSRKFNQIGGSGSEVIVNPGGLGFPASLANILEVNLLQANSGYTEPRKTDLTVIGDGETRYYRVYYRLDSETDVAVSDPEQHPIQDGSSAGQINWGWWVYQSTGGAGKWTLQWRPSASANSYPYTRWQLSTPLDKDTTYRFEWYIARITSTTFKAAVRIYSDADVLLYDSSDFYDDLGVTDLATYMASNNFTFFNVANMAGLNTGSNGLGGTDWHPGIVYSYQGAAASGVDCGWIGPYDPTNG